MTLSGYASPDTALDVSNSNTFSLTDPTNPVASTFARAVVTLQPDGTVTAVQDNAFSGNNQRAAILDPTTGNYITVGNAGNSGSGTTTATLDALSANTGVQVFNPSSSTSGGAFNTTVVGALASGSLGHSNRRPVWLLDRAGGAFAADKTGKDEGNSAARRSGRMAACTLQRVAVRMELTPSTKFRFPGAVSRPSRMPARRPFRSCPVSRRLSARTGKNADGSSGTVLHPFGLFFANATTLYVADEGNGTLSDATNEAGNTGGLEKWTFNTTTQQWVLDYTLTNQLLTGVSYSPAGYPTGNNPATNQPWAVYSDGLRNLSGKVNADGTVTIYGVTSTVSGDTDEGADPNEVVAITDTLADTTASQASSEAFRVVEGPQNETVYRGLAVVPEPGSLTLVFAGVAFLGGLRRRKA